MTSKLLKIFEAFGDINIPRKTFYENVSDETNKGKVERFSVFFSCVYTKSTAFIEWDSGNDCVKMLTPLNIFQKKEVIQFV